MRNKILSVQFIQPNLRGICMSNWKPLNERTLTDYNRKFASSSRWRSLPGWLPIAPVALHVDAGINQQAT